MSLALLTLAVVNVAATDASLAGAELRHHGLLLAQVDSPPPPPPPSVDLGQGGAYAGWSLEQLQLESRRLNDLRPSLVGPIVLLAVGAGVTAFIGLPLAFSGLAIVYAGGGVGYLIAGLAFALPGVAMIVIGAIWLGGRISERKAYADQIEDIDTRIRNYREAPRTGVPQVEQYRPASHQLVLARF